MLVENSAFYHRIYNRDTSLYILMRHALFVGYSCPALMVRHVNQKHRTEFRAVPSDYIKTKGIRMVSANSINLQREP